MKLRKCLNRETFLKLCNVFVLPYLTYSVETIMNICIETAVSVVFIFGLVLYFCRTLLLL